MQLLVTFFNQLYMVAGWEAENIPAYTKPEWSCAIAIFFSQFYKGTINLWQTEETSTLANILTSKGSSSIYLKPWAL